MGTEKRERQKANRQQRLIEEARADRQDVVKRNALRWTMGIVAAIGAVVLIAWVGGAFDGGDDEPETVITLPPLDTTPTTPPVTLEPLPKPEVEVPAEAPTDLVVTVLSPGEGPAAEAGDTVLVDYVGVRTEDGTEFDNSYDRGQQFPVTLGQGGVIQGWDEGLVGAQAGSQIQLDIPAELAYGDNPPGDPIQPGDALTFVIDVRSVTPASN
ncbi:MAG: FKBP-type peptidyl-prolyl cis-trans isomerase [Ilumatobacteraceae bacterium]|nr:FKBP-type peptidyl-prolyl cis-trans isomerase [Ilumatobacteraceae bacterium]